ncbi:hypothetical protein MB02_11815 [Croceicoccus estronivorus]|nr:hypothetical protein MB02_11815 [Croceicoccus estronivorus]
MLKKFLGQTPSADQLVERTQNLIPRIKPYADRIEQERSVPPEVIEMIAEAGLFRILQPSRWGGYEMSPRVFGKVQTALARADMSVGWVYGVLGVHNFQMGLFDDRAAQDVWGIDDSVRIASTFQPGGIATPVDGGYAFSGQWKFASGCDHADWVFLGGQLGGEFLTCLLPKEQYEIVDTWHVAGLKGTGSKDIRVAGVVIPEHRVHRSSDGFRCDSPGNKVNTGPLYRLPFHQVFIRAITNSAIGALYGMMDAFEDYAAARVGVVSGATVKDPDALLALGRAVALVDELEAVRDRNFQILENYAKDGAVPPFPQRLAFKYQAASVTDRCLEAARLLFQATGGTGLFDQQPFGRILADLTAARQHAAAQEKLTARSLGALTLKQDIQEWYL